MADFLRGQQGTMNSNFHHISSRFAQPALASDDGDRAVAIDALNARLS
jgi:hypothetical protein